MSTTYYRVKYINAIFLGSIFLRKLYLVVHLKLRNLPFYLTLFLHFIIQKINSKTRVEYTSYTISAILDLDCIKRHLGGLKRLHYITLLAKFPMAMKQNVTSANS